MSRRVVSTLISLVALVACGSPSDASSTTSADDTTAGDASTAVPGASAAETSTSSGAIDPTTAGPADASTGSADDTTTGWTPPADCGASALAELAATITPGTFVALATDGLDAALIDAGGGHNILQYSDKGVWDPNTCQALFTGGGHLALTKFIAYSASENTWFQAPNPSWWCETTADDPYACATHAYGANALDPATGNYWFRRFNNPAVYRTQVGSPISAQWDDAPELPQPGAGCIATALEYFPELGGLVYVDCSGQQLLFSAGGTAAWETLPGSYPMGPYHNYAAYSAARGQVLFGAGNDSPNLYLLDPKGSATAIAAPPRTFHPSPDDPSTLRILTADPISGVWLAIAPNGDMFEYDPDGDAWTAIAAAPAGLQIAIPVTTYGVSLFLTLEPQMYVYRHVAP